MRWYGYLEVLLDLNALVFVALTLTLVKYANEDILSIVDGHMFIVLSIALRTSLIPIQSLLFNIPPQGYVIIRVELT